MRAGCKQVGGDDKGRAERLADSNSNGDLSSGGSLGKRKGVLPGSAIKRDPRTNN